MTTTAERPKAETEHDVETLARDYIIALKRGDKLDHRPFSEKWDDIIFKLERAFKSGGAVAVQKLCDQFCFINSELKELLTLPPSIEDIVIEDDSGSFPALPESVVIKDANGNMVTRSLRFDPKLAASACPWLDEYIAFSKKWSPRGHNRFHEPIGIALLSTVAARRVGYQFGPQRQYTNFYIALLGESTFFRKSTTARIYEGLLGAAKLDWLYGSDVTTPQKLVSNMAGQYVPSNYGKLEIEEQETLKKRLAHSGQMGWFYDEFGMHMDQMVKENGVMADFKGLLRKLDDSKDKHGNDTVARSKEVIKKPYLTLLAAMTPSDIQPYAGKENKFWKDGLFARFCFVSIPPDEEIPDARFPKGFFYPASLVDPIKQWSDALGYAQIDIAPEKNKAGKETDNWEIVKMKDLPEQMCEAGPDIEDALYAYEKALLNMIKANKVPKAIQPNYGRLHVVALRVAILLASQNNNGRVEERHWARAQQFAEDRRLALHELYAQGNSDEQVASEASKLEDRILKVMHALRGAGHVSVTAAVLHGSWLKTLSTTELTKVLDSMADEKVGLLKKETTGAAKKGKYSLAQ